MTSLEEETEALEARLAGLRAAHAALQARVDATRDSARAGVPLRVFLLPFSIIAAVGGVLGLLAVELGRVMP